MDLDAIIARRPQIVLVDELAHTNAPGSRHPKRYLDVEEFLDHGIDVYTTVNIQHIESLNDVVAQITHVRVRETVPDSIFDRADAVELVDLTPDDLIQRLKEGKVYIPKQAKRALEHFFSPANLTALRELALRRTAERVDEQFLTQMQARAIPGPWAAGERILVCISEDPRAAGLVRYTKRLADRLHAPWTALYIETRRSLQLSEEQRDRIADTLRLAQSLEGEAVTIPGADRALPTTWSPMRRPTTSPTSSSANPPAHAGSRSCTARLSMIWCAASGNISVHVIAGEELDAEPIPKKTSKRQFTSPRENNRTCGRIGRSCRCVGRQPPDLPVVRLGKRRPPVSHRHRRRRLALWVVAVAARQCCGLLCYNFFFLPPVYSFTITSPKNVGAFVFFALIAMLVSNVAARVRSQALMATGRARTTESLYTFSRKLASVGTLDDVLWATAYQIALMLKVRVVLLLPEDGSIAVKAGYPPEDT